MSLPQRRVEEVYAPVVYVFMHFRDAFSGLLGQAVLFQLIHPSDRRHFDRGNLTAESLREGRRDILGGKLRRAA